MLSHRDGFLVFAKPRRNLPVHRFPLPVVPRVGNTGGTGEALIDRGPVLLM